MQGRGRGACIVFLPSLNGVTHQSHLPIFWPVNHRLRATDKAPRLYDLSTPSLKCLRVGGWESAAGGGVGWKERGERKREASSHRSGGACEGFLRLL